MAGHKIGTRDEWQAARDELAKLEAEHAERNEEIKKKRRSRRSRAPAQGRVPFCTNVTVTVAERRST